jgi:hypothetical protein
MASANIYTRVYRKVSGLASWIEKCEWYSTRCSCISILCVSLVSFAAITLCVASERVIPKVSIYSLSTQSGNLWVHSRTISHLGDVIATERSVVCSYVKYGQWNHSFLAHHLSQERLVVLQSGNSMCAVLFGVMGLHNHVVCAVFDALSRNNLGVTCKVKVKLSLCLYWGSGSIAPYIL